MIAKLYEECKKNVWIETKKKYEETYVCLDLYFILYSEQMLIERKLNQYSKNVKSNSLMCALKINWSNFLCVKTVQMCFPHSFCMKNDNLLFQMNK